MSCRQAGVGLVEVAIAALVITTAILGLARAQLAARELGFAAQQRTEAVAAAESLLTLARSAPGELAHLVIADSATPDAPLPDCSLRSCDSAQWARWNTWHWAQGLEGGGVTNQAGVSVAGLLRPRACVSVVHGEFQIELRWHRQDGVVAPAVECGPLPSPGYEQVSLTSLVGGGG